MTIEINILAGLAAAASAAIVGYRAIPRDMLRVRLTSAIIAALVAGLLTAVLVPADIIWWRSLGIGSSVLAGLLIGWASRLPVRVIILTEEAHKRGL